MDFELTEDQRAIRDLVRRIANEKVAPRANEIDKTAEYPQDMFDLLKELGLFTLPFPEEYGGTEDSVACCLAIEELGRVCYNTAYLLLVQWLPFGAILAGGSKEQKEKYLPGLASGDLRGAFSTTEPQSGSDVAGIKTRAVPVDGGYVINGAKIWCTNAEMSDFVLVAAKVGEGKGTGNINMFIIDRDTPGFEIGKKEDKMGARGVPSNGLFLTDVFVPENARLGPEGKGFKIVMEAFNKSRPYIGARAVGCAQGAIDHTIAFIKDRKAFGQQVSDFQGVRWMIADMVTKTEASRLMVYKAAAMVNAGVKGNDLAGMAAMSKLFATDTAMEVAEAAVQLFGAAGISSEYPIGRYFRDAKVLKIVEGTNQIQRNIIGKLTLAD
ncbi:acyl-CoA dehydrogenase [Sneathiella sp. P13V-1]|uniref:acyl-CoA dehydrogenase family protein n=1 Tax=Sneathiella sp. P13V-1 TaxID=2697366 RepID=UPI00187B3E0C|nr:acyl-CoA dehydrogenase family protein [Sneathiella sp. P13V-1]MBE7638609.1 acyl-CoA dehydrogenase [Sneathiella sp. P13V-1]